MRRRTQLPTEVLDFFRKQGSIGGKRRAENLTAAERTEQARKAVQARWAKKKKEKSKKK